MQKHRTHLNMYAVQTRLHLLQFYKVDISRGVRILQQLTSEKCQLTSTTILYGAEEISLSKFDSN
jgi:hypothetical protein